MTQHTAPTIVALASGKGGVGKSTACLGLAGALASKGHAVHIIDFDQNETLWTWYAGHEEARSIKNLTVEQAPKADVGKFLEQIYFKRDGYVLIDLAGHLNDVMMLVAAFADLVIIPTKLGIADVMQANKLAGKIHEIGNKIGKPIVHRILFNEIPFVFAASQLHLIKQVESMGVTLFDTMLRVRPAYAESQITGVPVHFDDQSRDSTRKACNELDALLDEITAVVDSQRLKAAA